MTTIIHAKLGEHRGKPRIWAEGAKLAREGFTPGVQYNVNLSEKSVSMVKVDGGQYVVSRRERNGQVSPIIDRAFDELANIFAGVKLLKIVVRRGRITVTAHHQHELTRERERRIMEKLTNFVPLSICSLFHGGGVIDKALHRGLEREGASSVISVAVELESKYIDSSLNNNPELWSEDSLIIEGPIQAINVLNRPPQCDGLHAGIPCTGASRSGKAKNGNDFAEEHEAAGAMFYSTLQFIQACNPAYVVLENVPDYATTASMAVIRSVLQQLDYVIFERVLNGNEFGALENRDRLCIVAISEGLATGFDMDKVVPRVSKPMSLRDIMEDIPEGAENWKPYDYLKTKEEADKKAGKGFRRQLLTGDEAYCGTIGKGYSKARSTEPFIVSPFDPALSRLLTPTEHAAVKRIPPEVVSGLPSTTAHEILGQSVIFPVFEAVASAVAKQLWSCRYMEWKAFLFGPRSTAIAA